MRNHNSNSSVNILAVIVIFVLGILALKSYEDNTVQGRTRKAKREFDKQAQKLKEKIYGKYNVAKDEFEDNLDDAKDKAEEIKSKF